MAPIAIQDPIAVSIDFNGGIVNDIYNQDPHYELTDLHLCVFPQKNTTAVMLFHRNGDIRYRQFRRQFRKLDDNSKLGAINYMIFLYSEDFFMAKEIQEKLDLSIFNDVLNITPAIWSDTPYINTSILADKYSLSKWNSIPNLLSKKYEVKKAQVIV